MAMEDADVRQFVIWRVFPVCVVAGAIFYCRYKGVTWKSIRLRIIAYLTEKVSHRFHNRPQLVKVKQQLFSKLQDQKTSARQTLQILEIGAGGGANFRYYPSGSQVLCLDPNPYFEGYLKQNVELSGVDMKGFIKGFAEDMRSVEDSSVDAVVCTMVMCSVKDANKALSEIKRVLKPNGVFYFVEHVAASRGTCLNRVQRLMNPLWHWITGDCQINKETGRIVDGAGFSRTSIDYFTFETKLFFIRPFLSGTATK